MDAATPEQETKMDGPEVHAPHAPHTGHRWWDFAIGGSAMVVSLISLYVAIHHGEIMEKLVAANSWPNVEASANVGEGKTTGGVRFQIDVRNNGVGPARVESLELWDAKTPIGDAAALAAQLKAAADGGPLNARLEGASVAGQVIGARETITVVAFEAPDLARWSVPMIRLASQIESRVCYCSVFDECYVADTRIRRGRAEKIDECPVPAQGFADNVGELLVQQLAKQAKVPKPPAPKPDDSLAPPR